MRQRARQGLEHVVMSIYEAGQDDMPRQVENSVGGEPGVFTGTERFNTSIPDEDPGIGQFTALAVHGRQVSDVF